MSSVDTPLHGSSGSELGSYGENSSGPNTLPRKPAVLNVLPVPVRNFEDDEDDDVGDIDVDTPLSPEDEHLLNQITDFESSESDLESVSRDRKELFASPLLMAAMSVDRKPEDVAASRRQDTLLWEQRDNAPNSTSAAGGTPLRQAAGSGRTSRIQPNRDGAAAANANQGDANLAKQTNPYRRTEVLVAAAVVVLCAIAVGVAVPVIRNNRKTTTQLSTPRPSFPPIGRKTFAPSRDPLAPPTSLGPPSHQSSGPILITFTAAPSRATTQLRTTSPSRTSTISHSSAPSKSPPPTSVPSSVVRTKNPTSLQSSSPTHTPTLQSSSAPTLKSSPPTQLASPPPTLTATVTFTSPPTKAPRLSTAPSFSPFQTNRRGDITSLIFSISGVFVFLDNNSPQFKAFQWILNSDPLQLLATDVPAIIQRYTLATLYYATDSRNTWTNCGPQGTSTSCSSEDARFLSNSSECKWYGVSCLDGNITSLNFRLNGMQGPMPPELGELSLLTQLTFSRNSLSSSIPVALSKLTLLQTFLLNRNNLTGTIPTELGRLSSMQYLHLGLNRFTGTIPTEIFTASLQNLDLGVNRLHGTIPNFIPLSPGVINIDLSSNMLTGPLLEFGQLTSLNSLALDHNFLSGTISRTLITTGTTAFTIGGNNISGTVSETFFAQGKSLTILNLGNNTIEGTLSTRFGELSNLAELVLWYNRFTGTIPTELGELKLLAELEISGNELFGSMPSEVCALRSAQLIALASDCGGRSPRINCTCCTLCL